MKDSSNNAIVKVADPIPESALSGEGIWTDETEGSPAIRKRLGSGQTYWIVGGS